MATRDQWAKEQKEKYVQPSLSPTKQSVYQSPVTTSFKNMPYFQNPNPSVVRMNNPINQGYQSKNVPQGVASGWEDEFMRFLNSMQQPQGNTGGYYAGGYGLPAYEPYVPPMKSRAELEEMAKLYAELEINPQLEILDRLIEEARLSSQGERETVSGAKDEGLANLAKTVESQHRGLSDTAVKRGIYDSGEAKNTSTRLDLKHQEAEGQATQDYGRVVNAIAQELAQLEKHNRGQKEQLTERKGKIQSSMLNELMLNERSRQDMLGQQDFNNYVTRQGLAMQAAPKYYAGGGGSSAVQNFGNLAEQFAWQQVLGGKDIKTLPTALQFAMGYHDPYKKSQSAGGTGALTAEEWMARMFGGSQ